MIQFNYYNKGYKFPANKGDKRQIEDYIRKYYSDNFAHSPKMDFSVFLIPDGCLSEGVLASAIPEEMTIKINYDYLYDYFKHLKLLKGKLVIPEIKKKHRIIHNSLHHEIQHLINLGELVQVHDYIFKMDTFKHIKVCLYLMVDEYIASYTAQKKYFMITNATDHLVNICDENENEAVVDKLNMFIGIVQSLTYAVAENRCLVEMGKENELDLKLLENNSCDRFISAFLAIEGALNSFSHTQHERFVSICQSELYCILETMEVDFSFLKLI